MFVTRILVDSQLNWVKLFAVCENAADQLPSWTGAGETSATGGDGDLPGPVPQLQVPWRTNCAEEEIPAGRRGERHWALPVGSDGETGSDGDWGRKRARWSAHPQVVREAGGKIWLLAPVSQSGKFRCSPCYWISNGIRRTWQRLRVQILVKTRSSHCIGIHFFAHSPLYVLHYVLVSYRSALFLVLPGLVSVRALCWCSVADFFFRVSDWNKKRKKSWRLARWSTAVVTIITVNHPQTWPPSWSSLSFLPSPSSSSLSFLPSPSSSSPLWLSIITMIIVAVNQHHHHHRHHHHYHHHHHHHHYQHHHRHHHHHHHYQHNHHRRRRPRHHHHHHHHHSYHYHWYYYYYQYYYQHQHSSHNYCYILIFIIIIVIIIIFYNIIIAVVIVRILLQVDMLFPFPQHEPPSPSREFPAPSGKEFILRSTIPRPSPASRLRPQRLYCVITDDEFRLAGAFTDDVIFQWRVNPATKAFRLAMAAECSSQTLPCSTESLLLLELVYCRAEVSSAEGSDS